MKFMTHALAAVAAAVSAALTLSPATSPGATSPDTRATSQVTAESLAYPVAWRACEQAPKVRCGTMRVPLDWTRPRGALIELYVAQRPADDPAHRIGTLFYNPGGPGDASTNYVINAEEVFSPGLLARFDLVALDPRGVGKSSPIRCSYPLLPPDYRFFPRTEAEFESMLRHNKALGASCLADTGPLLGHVDTVSVSRDHDALRAALNVDRVSWFGVSYGSQIAMNYAALFPRRTRVMVIDSALEHSGSEVSMLSSEILTAESTFNRFVRWCRAAEDCALKGQDVAAVFDRLVARADKHPIPVAGALRPVLGEDIRMRTVKMLNLKEPSLFGSFISWPGTAEAIKAAVNGDASAFALPPVEFAGGLVEAGANACMDYQSEIRTWAEMQQRLRLGRVLAPHLQGATEQWQIVHCIGWPIAAANPPRRLDIRGVPTLIVNGEHDPSTSYSWALGLAGQVEGSDLLTRRGDGHTSYRTSSCARAAIDTYLIQARSTWGIDPDRVCSES